MGTTELTPPTRGVAISTRWGALCKDCQRRGDSGDFQYPDVWIESVVERGGSRSDRCPRCRQVHARDARSFAAPYVDIDTIGAVTDRANPTGPLGGLGPLPVEHVRDEVRSDLSAYDFGLKDADILRLLNGLTTKQVAIVVAGTGTGKSTFLPYRLLVPPEGAPLHLTERGPIIITEPRRAATTDTATFVAKHLHKSAVGAGSDIGYRVQNEPAYDAGCRLLYVTDGSLINWLRDGSFKRFGAIMVDEAHERSKNIDLILGFLRAVLPHHPDLKVIIASATIDAGFFVEYFGGPDAVFSMEIPAHKQWGYGQPLWPLETTDDAFLAHPDWQRPGLDGVLLRERTAQYAQLRTIQEPIDPGPRCANWRARMPEAVAEQVLRLIDGTESGDVLAFLPGQATIDMAIELIRAGLETRGLTSSVDVFELMRTSPPDVQIKARGEKSDPTRRRVVISTNIAETSLTIDGITFVVDSGLITQSEWNVDTASKKLPAVAHSQDGVRQRWGRVGRKAPGWVFPLYTREQYEQVLPAHTPPESVRDDLEQFVLTAKAAGVMNPEAFLWPAAFQRTTDGALADDPYQRTFLREITRSAGVLTARGVIDADGDLTTAGRELQGFSGSMSHAMALTLADRLGVAVEMATALPLLSGGSIAGGLLRFDRQWPVGRRHEARQLHEANQAGCIDDLDVALRVYTAWEAAPDPQQWAESRMINHELLAKVRLAREEMLDPLTPGRKSKVLRPIALELLSRVRAVLSQTLIDQTYCRSEAGWKPLLPSDGDLQWELDARSPNKNLNRLIAFRRSAGSRNRGWLSNVVAAYDWAADKQESWVPFALRVSQEFRRADGSATPSQADTIALTTSWQIGQRYQVQLTQSDETMRIYQINALGREWQVQAPSLGSPTSSDTHQAPLLEGSDYTGEEVHGELVDGEAVVLESSNLSEEEAPPLEADSSETAITNTELMSLAQPGVIDPTQEPQYTPVEELEVTDDDETNATTSDLDIEIPKQLRVLTAPTVRDVACQFVDGRMPTTASTTIRVLGYEQTGTEWMLLVVADDGGKSWGDNAVNMLTPGRELHVRLIEAVHGWGDPYLVTAEEQTGLETLLEAGSLTFGRVDQSLPPVVPRGAPLTVELVNVDSISQALIASRLQIVHNQLAALSRAEDDGMLLAQAVVVDVGSTAAMIALTDSGEPDVIAPRYRVRRITMSKGRIPVEIGRLLVAHLALPRSSDDTRVVRLQTPAKPQGLTDVLKEQDSVRWHPDRQVLESDSVMDRSLRDRLLSLSSSDEWQKAVQELWIASQNLEVVTVEPASDHDREQFLEELRARFAAEPLTTGQVTNVVPHLGVFVLLDDGVDGLIRSTAIGPEGVFQPQRYFTRGDAVIVRVDGINERGQIQAAIPRDDIPSKQEQLRELFPEDATLTAKVNNVVANLGVFVTLAEGITALAHKDSIGSDGVIDVTQYFQVNDVVDVRIERINEKGQIHVSLQNVLIPPRIEQFRTMYPAGSLATGTINNVRPDLGIFVTLDRGMSALAHKSRIGSEGVIDPSHFFKSGQPIQVQIGEMNDRGQIQLSVPDPSIPPILDQLRDLYPRGDLVDGRINNVVPHLGVFVTLNGGISGLIHIGKLRRPTGAYQSGQIIRVTIAGDVRPGKRSYEVDLAES